mmetsp:Transcript_39857/g.118669  ORF Transcript_39857/g.118669 Transcript_39857/m.118669 type:complete len:350 (-) Transcript_39857:209-1258(-)
MQKCSRRRISASGVPGSAASSKLLRIFVRSLTVSLISFMKKQCSATPGTPSVAGCSPTATTSTSKDTWNVGWYPSDAVLSATHVATLLLRSMWSADASKYVTYSFEIRMGSSNDLNSTVPTADDGSIGVNMKWLRGDTTMTSYCSVSMTLMMACAPQPDPSTNITGLSRRAISMPPPSIDAVVERSILGCVLLSCLPRWRPTSLNASYTSSVSRVMRISPRDLLGFFLGSGGPPGGPDGAGEGLGGASGAVAGALPFVGAAVGVRGFLLPSVFVSAWETDGGRDSGRARAGSLGSADGRPCRAAAPDAAWDAPWDGCFSSMLTRRVDRAGVAGAARDGLSSKALHGCSG